MANEFDRTAVVNSLMGDFGYTRNEAHDIVDQWRGGIKVSKTERPTPTKHVKRLVEFGKGTVTHGIDSITQGFTDCGKMYGYSDDISTIGEVTCKKCLKAGE